MELAERKIIGLVSEDDSGSDLIRALAGLSEPKTGELWQRFHAYGENQDSFQIGFIPDDIVCYSGMRTRDFIRGLLWTCSDRDGTEREAVRLLELFDIPLDEKLLDLTFEQGRLVVMIQVLMRKPELLLVENPHAMISDRTYLVLLREWIKLFKENTRYIITGHTYEDIVFPCEYYLFLREGNIIAEYPLRDLPNPAKVITMTEGDPAKLDASKMKIIYQNKHKICFIYEETDMGRLSSRLGQAGCRDYTVEDIRLEERVFENYERWLE